jgi:hypothetical protein
MERLNNRRRGVLLLIVLSLLTLFMMLGATYLVLAARARATARAFAAATNSSSSLPSVSQGQAFVDEAFLRVVRGSVSGSSGVISTANTLLGDKYGTTAPQTGTIVSGATSGSVIISMVVTCTAPAESLTGRVLTFTLPGLNNASVRVLRAEPVAAGSTARLYLPAGPTLSGENLTATNITNAAAAVTGTTHFVINGREFSGSPASGSSDANEPYDGYDGRNDFLANPLSPSTRPSFSGSGSTANNLAVDNDSDGTADSGWIDIGLPPITLPSGTVYPRAAVLVTDLDGRLNLNLHGSLASIEAGPAFYPSQLTTGTAALLGNPATPASFATYPRGLGGGPAELALDQQIFFDDASKPSADVSFQNITAGITATGAGTDPITSRPPPRVGPIEGRYGGNPMRFQSNERPSGKQPRPGAPLVDDAPHSPQSANWLATTGTNLPYYTRPGRYASPPDVKGRMRLFVDDYGQPVFYKPSWTNETLDDPYEVPLLRLASRSTSPISRAARLDARIDSNPIDENLPDSPYSAADLAGLLTVHDPAVLQLPQRLIAILGVRSGTNRLGLTTDNWDTTAMTGGARAAVSQLITTATTSNVSMTDAMAMFAPETLMGHRLDLNRPFHDTNPEEPNDGTGTAERRRFAKHLYVLAYALAGSGTSIPTAEATQLAQWAVNIVDFRDRDSILTGFEYDTNPTNGWGVDDDLTTTTESDRAVAWGCERPEILITETVCWHDRRTDDLSVGTGNETTLVTSVDNQRDDDFDQQRRPQGAFYFELYSPWRSQLAEFDDNGSKIKAVQRIVQSGSMQKLRAEPIPGELAAYTNGIDTAATGTNALARFSTDATLNLSGTAPSGHPVWRILTVRRTNNQGTKPVVTDPLVSGTTWRTIYFARPPASFVKGNTNSGDIGFGKPAYWSSTASIALSPQSPKVFGTPPFQAPGSAPAGSTPIDTIYRNPTDGTSVTTATRAATLTEPMVTAGTDAISDPYAILAGVSFDATQKLASPQDQPFDDKTSSTHGITKLTGPDGLRTLFQNGRHANFFFAHLQRLANPAANWNKDTNPYITVDTQPIDLVVINLNEAGDKNYDEPCVDAAQATANNPPAGGAFSDLRTRQRSYLDPYEWENGSAASAPANTNISLERGRTQLTISGTDRDIWSARINPRGADDDYKLLSNDTANYREESTLIDFPQGNPNQDGTLINFAAPTTTPGTNQAIDQRTHTLGELAARFGGGTAAPDRSFPWLPWHNRPFVAVTELAIVPHTSPFALLRLHATGVPSGSDQLSTGPFGHLPGFYESVTPAAPWARVTGRGGGTTAAVWDAVHVPSPFGGGYQTVPTAQLSALAAVGLNRVPFDQLPHFREAGRVNVNTITGSSTWTALIGTGTAGTAVTMWTPTTFATPATSLLDSLGRLHPMVSETTSYLDTFSTASRDAAIHPVFRYQTLSRLTNQITVRSNVFAVWVTIGYSTSPTAFSEAGLDTGEIRRHRGFYIYDRSIPVGFDPGKDLNVRDAILLRRIVQ